VIERRSSSAARFHRIERPLSSELAYDTSEQNRQYFRDVVGSPPTDPSTDDKRWFVSPFQNWVRKVPAIISATPAHFK